MKRVVHDQVASMQFRPDAHHRSVQAVLEDPKLSSDEKRAILSAWASDMYAVEILAHAENDSGAYDATPAERNSQRATRPG